MNYAFMSFSCPDATLARAVGLAQQFGYTGFEPRVENQHAHGIELDMSAAARQAVKTQLEAGGVELCCLALGSSFVDPDTRPAQVDKTLRYLDLANDIGTARLRVFGGNLVDGMSRQQATDLLVQSFKQLAPEAETRGLTLCLETHDGWCNPDHVAAVMRAVDSPAVGVNWDIMHPVRAGGATIREAFGTLQPWIKHVHVHDGLTDLDTLTMLPVGTGELDNREAVQLLKETNYSGFLSGEWIKSTMSEAFFANHLGEEIAALKEYESDL